MRSHDRGAQSALPAMGRAKSGPKTNVFYKGDQ